MNIPKVGIGVIIIKDGKSLLGKRKNSHGAGYWAFPGGHLDYGETPEECAKRELKEETGIEALSVHRGTWVNNVIETGKHYITLYMYVTSFIGEPRLLEPHKCEGWSWFEKQNMPQPLFPAIETLMNLKNNDHFYW